MGTSQTPETYTLVDKRGGHLETQIMEKRQVDEGSAKNRSSYVFTPIQFNGREVRNPYWPFGYYLSVASPSVKGSKTEIRSHKGNLFNPALVERVIM